MRVKMVGGGAGYGPHGVMTSWAPNGIVDIDDADVEAVAFYREKCDDGSATLVEDADEDTVDAATEAAVAEAQAVATEAATTSTVPDGAHFTDEEVAEVPETAAGVIAWIGEDGADAVARARVANYVEGLRDKARSTVEDAIDAVLAPEESTA